MLGVLSLIGFGTRHLFTRDSLAGVKTIHFARWIPLDGDRRVVFASNYDGSVESYNNDFIDLVSVGLNLVFSNGAGYPRTALAGPRGRHPRAAVQGLPAPPPDPDPGLVFRVPGAHGRQRRRNACLRAGLRGAMTEREAQQWLRLL